MGQFCCHALEQKTESIDDFSEAVSMAHGGNALEKAKISPNQTQIDLVSTRRVEEKLDPLAKSECLAQVTDSTVHDEKSLEGSKLAPTETTIANYLEPLAENECLAQVTDLHVHEDKPLVGSKVALVDISIVGFEEKLREIHTMCLSVRIIEAYKKLESLEQEMKTVTEEQAWQGFIQRLNSDVVVGKLRREHARIMTCMEKLIALLPSDMGAGDVRFGKYSQAVPSIHRDCRFELIARFLEGDERDEKKNPTQFVVIFNVWNCSISLPRMAALYSQTDLYKAEWDAGCRTFEGWSGGPEQFHSALSFKVKKSVIPFQSDVEIAVIRDFCVCKEAPFPGYGPGVLAIGSPVDVLDETDGWKVPPPKPGVPRSAPNGIDYIMPGDHLDTCHVMFLMTMDVPIPQWMVSLQMGTKLLGKMAIGTLTSSKEKCWDKWAETGLEERLVTIPDFINSVMSLKSTA